MRNRVKIFIVGGAVAVVAAVVLLWQLGAFSSFGKTVVCLDAGHGGSDVGAECDSRYEKDDNLRLTLAVGKILEENGVTVIYTRTQDEFVELEERAEFANKEKADFFVSIHRNSAEIEVSGVEIWIENTAAYYEEQMAQAILDKICQVGYGTNRGVRRGYQGNPSENYLVNSATQMPSCLVEMGFITTPEDNRLFDENFEEYAQAIAEGIMESVRI